MFRTHLGEYAPIEMGFGSKLKMTNDGRSSRSVPPLEREDYPKSPSDSSDSEQRRKDLFFFGVLFAVVGGRSFQRLDLDVGRMNRLWADGILEEVSFLECATSREKRFRLNAAQAAEVFATVGAFDATNA